MFIPILFFGCLAGHRPFPKHAGQSEGLGSKHTGSQEEMSLLGVWPEQRSLQAHLYIQQQAWDKITDNSYYEFHPYCLVWIEANPRSSRLTERVDFFEEIEDLRTAFGKAASPALVV